MDEKEFGKNKMKVLMIIKKLRYSGAYKMFMWVAAALANSGFDVTVLTYMRNDVGELPQNIKWIRADLERGSLIKKILYVRHYVKLEKPDASISFLLDANVINILACLGQKTKSIVCERNDPFKPHYHVMKIVKPFFRFANGAVFQLPKVKSFYSNIKSPSRIIPNPIQSHEEVLMNSFRERKNVIVTLGRLDIFQKRHDVLINAFAKFVKEFPDYELRIYGDGPDQKKLQDQIDCLGLNNKIILAGVSDSPLETIKDAKFFVLTSDFEGIPNALAEAMSIGLPCISTDCRPGGAALLINDGINGILVPPAEEKVLCERMVDLARDGEYADLLGKNAKMISMVYSEEKITKMWVDYLYSLKEDC